MNNVQLVGSFTRDPEIRYANSGTCIARFTLAVDRGFKSEGGPDADFISCAAFGKTAEFIEKYFFKGQRIGLIGRIQTGNYTKEDGTKVYTTDVVAERVEFVESKGSSSVGSQQAGSTHEDSPGNDGFMNIPDGIDDELPLN